jgi:hypothetical protein
VARDLGVGRKVRECHHLETRLGIDIWSVSRPRSPMI